MSRDLFDYLFDRYDEQEAAEFAELMRRRNAPALVRCMRCRYRLDSAGHRTACGQLVSERAA